MQAGLLAAGGLCAECAMLGRFLIELAVTALLLGGFLLGMLLVVPFPTLLDGLSSCGLCGDALGVAQAALRAAWDVLLALG